MSEHFLFYFKGLPTLSVRVNGVLAPPGSNISFRSFPSINISCTANSPRASVVMFIGNITANRSLPLLNLGPGNPNPLYIDTSVITQVYLTPGWAFWNLTYAVTCSVRNSTVPYNMSNSVTYPLDFNSKYF
jgi:hypothetical protein